MVATDTRARAHGRKMFNKTREDAHTYKLALSGDTDIPPQIARNYRCHGGLLKH
jgi:hypothetical protein